uniref:Dirigent protein n=1 Tax=Aegilops tauschii subsp. strangulata TaxID=200361 RepID=A0A453ICM9_AEGTS
PPGECSSPPNRVLALLRARTKMAKAALCMMLALALTSCAFAGRVLNEHPAAPPVEADPLPGPTEPPVDTVVVPVPAAASPLPSDAAGAAGVAPAAGAGATANLGAGVAAGAGDSPLTFFMHDILGSSSQPSALMVTGVVASADDLVSSNNVVPYDSLVQSNGNAVNGGYKNTIPSVNAGGGATPQNLLFGMTTVVDEELAGGHELGAAAVGRAQGFYVASSQDGSSKTVVLTALFGGEAHGDTLSFFGVHRTGARVPHRRHRRHREVRDRQGLRRHPHTAPRRPARHRRRRQPPPVRYSPLLS